MSARKQQEMERKRARRIKVWESAVFLMVNIDDASQERLAPRYVREGLRADR